MKNFAGDFLQMCTKNHNHVRFLRYEVRQAQFLVVLGKILKKKKKERKKMPGDIILLYIHVHHK